MDIIYLVVKESGEYSDWDKKNVSYFKTEEEAKQYADLYQELNDINKEESIFSVETIHIGKLPDNGDILIADAMNRSQIHKANIEAVNKKRMKQEIQSRKDSAKRIATEMNTLIDECEMMNEPFYTEKKQDMLRKLHGSLPNLIKQTDDIHSISRAREWILNNS